LTRIFLIQPQKILDWENGYIQRIRSLAGKNPAINNFVFVENEDDADLVVLVDSCTFKTQKNIKEFESLLYFNENNTRLCTLNYEDAPPGFLPGLYSSLEAYKFDASMHLSWPHLIFPNEKINAIDHNEDIQPDCLYTFSGACSSPVRRRMFDLYPAGSDRYKIQEVKKWYNHNESEKQSYIDDIRRSKFVLCPKGIASYSHRIYETLAMGRVPVIIADDWVPFSIEEKNYFIKIPENDIDKITRILEANEGRYALLNENVQKVYNKYFNQANCYSIALNQLCKLYRESLINITSSDLKNHWKTKTFWKNNKWTMRDRIKRKAGKLFRAFSK
jgi:hypothetical protein